MIVYQGYLDLQHRRRPAPKGPAHRFMWIRMDDDSGPSLLEIDDWCDAYFGSDIARWCTDGFLWEIFRDDDALAFRLRWC